MDIYKLKWTRLQAEIFRFLCINAGQIFNLREIAKQLRVSPTAVSKSLIELEKEKLIIKKEAKKINLFSIELNRDSQRAIELKRVENLKLIYESELSELLFNEFPGGTIILFGSYSKGEDVWVGENKETKSDIDIALIGVNERKIDISKYETLLNKKIIINFYKDWKMIHKNLKDSILNGILLKGSIDL